MRVIPLGWMSYFACARDLALPMHEVVPPDGLMFRPANAHDFHRIAALTASPDYVAGRLRLGEIQRRYEKGDVCFVGDWHDTLVYLSWMRFDKASLARFGIEAPLLPREAYLGALFTVAAYRGRGVAMAAAVARRKWLLERGIRNLYTWVSPSNVPAWTMMHRAVFRRVGRVAQLFLRVGRNLPLVSWAEVPDPADPLAQWCLPERLTFRSGAVVFRLGQLSPQGERT